MSRSRKELIRDTREIIDILQDALTLIQYTDDDFTLEGHERVMYKVLSNDLENTRRAAELLIDTMEW